MPKTKISEYSATANSNTDVASINIDEGCAPSGINNAIRAIMGHLKDFQSGTSNDPFTVGSSGSLTLSYGTANGVAYLNGSKVLTTGSALSFNGNTFSVNGTSPGVGINDTTATLGVSFSFLNGGAFYSYGQIALRDTTNSQTAYAYSSGASGYHNWFQNGTEKMRLDSSGNLGIGTSSPSSKLNVYGNYIKAEDGTYAGFFGKGSNVVASGGTADLGISTTTGNILFGTGASIIERMRIDSGGKLLLGVTSGTGLSNGDFAMGNGNHIRFRNAANSAYISAFEFTSANGLNIGTGGSLSTITFGISGIGEAGRFDTSGRFAIAVAGNAYSQDAGLTVNGTGFTRAIYTNINGTASSTHCSFANGNGVVGSISTSGSTTTYSTSSDYRLKNITGPLIGAKDFIMALQPKQGTWKADGSKFVGFLAHEFQEVSPSSVTGEKDAVDADGKPIMQSMQASSSEVIANMVSLLQEQQAIIQSLTARITALEGA